MNDTQKLFIRFLLGCMGLRTLLAIVAKEIDVNYLKYMAYPALLPAFGFLYIFVMGSQGTGTDAMSQKNWWNIMRPVHATMYLAFAYFAIRGERRAWLFLAADVLLGLTAFLTHHYLEGDFEKLGL